jgi:hypothetical protein
MQLSVGARHELKIYMCDIGAWKLRWKNCMKTFVFMKQYSWEVLFALWLHLFLKTINITYLCLSLSFLYFYLRYSDNV